MGTQKPKDMSEEPEEIVSGPVAEHHGKKKDKAQSQKQKVEEKIKEKKFEKSEKPAEEAGEIEEGKAEGEKPAEEKEAQPKKEKVGKAKKRSKKYQEAKALVDVTKKYEVSEAIDLVKKTSFSKFDGNVEVHLRLLSKSGKSEKLRGLIKYPHATGRSIKVVVLDEKVAAEIEKTGKAEADVYLATPTIMPKIAKLAKILGPKGKMPNPKSGTITADPEKTMKELAGGQVEYKTDSYGNIHQVIGKVSAEPKALEENLQALLAVLPKEQIIGLTVCATMGPGVKVQL